MRPSENYSKNEERGYSVYRKSHIDRLCQRLPKNTKTQSSCQMPTEMQRYKVDFHKLIYGAVKPAEGKKA